KPARPTRRRGSSRSRWRPRAGRTGAAGTAWSWPATLPAGARSGGRRRPGRAGGARGARGAARRRAAVGARVARAADLVDRPVLAAAVDVELPAVALDDEERLAVAPGAGVVDEHPVARAAHDLLVAVALDGLRALALRGVAGGGLGVRRLRLVGVLPRGGLELRVRGAVRAVGLRALGLGGRCGGGRGGDGVGHEWGTGSVVANERTMAPAWAATSRAPAPATATASSVKVRPGRGATAMLCTRPAAGRAK